MAKFIRVSFSLLAVTLIAAATAVFFYAEWRSKTLNNIKLDAVAAHSNWEKNNCLEDPQPCADYSEQFKNWLSDFEQYTKNREKKPEFQFYLFFKNLDQEYIPIPDYNFGGRTTLVLACVLFLLWTILINSLLGNKRKNQTTYNATEDIIKQYKTKPVKGVDISPRKATFTAATAGTAPKPDINELLRKATECSESEPMQAISYLEQAIEGSFGTKLPLPALLLCGSLRLKNKIGENKGREQLQKIISASPTSPEAEKAKTVLDTFK
jgi:hypothetical protein